MNRLYLEKRGQDGFTLIELVITIVLIGVLAAVALPRFSDLGSESRRAALEQVAGTLRSTISIAQSKARVSGLSRAQSNPGGSAQTGLIIEIETGRAEVDWRNLCPESQAETGDQLTMLDYISIEPGETEFETQVTNQFTRVGFNLSSDPGQACYVEYDSFGDPNCTVTVFNSGC